MPELTKEQVREAFDIIDADGNGGLDIKELRRVLEQLGLNPTDQDLKGVLEICDTDNSGFIEYDEFEKAMLG